MARTKDIKNLVERTRQKVSEKNTIHINGSEVQSHLEPKTRKSYQRQLDNFYQLVTSTQWHTALELINRFARGKSGASPNVPDPPKEFLQHLAYDLESLKEFVQHLVFDINSFEAHETPTKKWTLMGQKARSSNIRKTSQLVGKWSVSRHLQN